MRPKLVQLSSFMQFQFCVLRRVLSLACSRPKGAFLVGVSKELRAGITETGFNHFALTSRRKGGGAS